MVPQSVTPARVAAACGEALTRLREHHLRPLAGSQGNVLFISGEYNGVWLEHVFDGVVWAELTGESAVAREEADLFLRHQKEDGQIPCFVWESKIGYSQLQECVSYGALCLDVYRLTQDGDFLRRAYEGLARWDQWLCANRMRVDDLIDTYCGYDTGHDNSGRLAGWKYPGATPSRDAAVYPEDCPVAPLLCPDVNAVFYGDRKAIAEMAALLGESEAAAAWAEKAEATRLALIAACRGEDGFFYDVDKEGKMRPCRSISITNVFTEGVLPPEEVRALFDRFFRDPAHFGTPFPYPSVAASDPTFTARTAGNGWGYWCQGLTMLRTLRWMKRCGLEAELHENMQTWLAAWTDSEVRFGQELDPFTGAPSPCSPYYSSTMLFYLASAKELGLWSN